MKAIYTPVQLKGNIAVRYTTYLQASGISRQTHACTAALPKLLLPTDV